MVTLSQAER